MAIADNIVDREFKKFRGEQPGRSRVAIEDDATFYTIIQVENANLKFVGENRSQNAPRTNNDWRVRREVTTAGITTIEYAGSGDFEHQFDEPSSLFPVILLANTLSTDFDGINDVCNGGDIVNFDSSNSFSISMWIKPDNFASQRAFFSKTTSDTNVHGFVLYQNTSGQPFLQMRAPGTNRQHTFAGPGFVEAVWQHIVLTYSGAQNIDGANFYLDSVVSDTPASGTLGSWLSSQDFTVGARNTAFPFSGRIDHVFIMNKELNQGEVTELYNNGQPTDPDQLTFSANIINWWRMGDGDTFPTIADNRGLDNLTMVNMTADDFVLDVP